ncbi:MAG: DUF4386 family protein [Cyclobacteriaceae bacterium]|nr:DUF4386 family protein [Cyclobacteriaceae bacterium]
MKSPDSLKGLYKIGGVMALVIVVLIPVQIFIFIAWPPPDNPLDYFLLFQKNWLLGLLSLDLLYNILNNTLLIFVYLGLYAALKRANQASMLIALILGVIGIAAYYSSTAAFEMLSLSNKYTLASTAELRLQYLASGQTMLAIYKGTAFNVYYVLNAITLLIISRVMLTDSTFSKTNALWGLISGILMLVPTTAGTIGLILGIVSLIPWIVFSVLTASRFFKLSQ